MRCAKCGAPSTVKETRESPVLFLIKRRRLCYNGHKFSTYEVHSHAFSAIGSSKIERMAEQARLRVERFARHLRIWRASKTESFTSLSIRFGMVKKTVESICTRMTKDQKDNNAS